MGGEVSANRDPDMLEEEDRWLWRRAAIAGQFCDAYIKDTNLEGGFMCTSLSVFVTVLGMISFALFFLSFT
jgi:hypothetical protein